MERLTWKEIQEWYSDQWVGLVDVEFEPDNQSAIKSAIDIIHSGKKKIDRSVHKITSVFIERERNMQAVILIAAVVTLMAVFTVKINKNKEKEKQIERIKKAFGKKPEEKDEFSEDIRIYYEMSKENLPANSIDAITWNDLEMDRIFDRINNTKSYIGEQMLYQRLHTLENEDCATGEMESREDYFRENEDARIKLEVGLSKIGKRENDYYLPVFLFCTDNLAISHVFLYRILQLLLLGSFVLGAGFENYLCLAICAGTALVNLGIYALQKDKYEAYLTSLGSLKSMVSFAKQLVTETQWKENLNSEKIQDAVKSLNKLTGLIGNYQMKKADALTGDVMGIVRDYLIGVTLWDFTIFKKIINLIAGKLDDILVLYEFIGELDMEISIASFRQSLPYYCMPTKSREKQINMEKLYHPLIEQPISNDLYLKKNCIITGSNASGKSTFIKAVAVNAILAQSINTCMAERFEFPELNIMTSMTVRDDILSGESYYIREVKYLKRIVEGVQNQVATLCIIDEILRGTNTQERLAASEAVLQYLTDKNCIVIVATHDMELASALQNQYQCYHFSNYIEDSNIMFDYKIREGANETKNAIELLKYIGFPKEIVDMAQNLC